MGRLVVHSNGAYLEDCVEKISRLAAVKGISLSVNAQSGNAMRCGGSTTLWGEPHLEEHVNGVRLLMSASSFSQLNREVMAAMYISAGKLIKTTPAVIWDLYCGVGGLGLTASKKYPHVRLFGADFVDEAMVSARINASNAQIDAHFEAFDLTKGLPSGWERPDVVLLNPPRRGVDAVVKQALTSILPSEIVYMSCNPETFASDVAEFSAAGYSLSDVYAHDMLPFTSHIEVIAALRTAS